MARCMLYFRMPKNKTERIRARDFGSLGIWGIWTYMCAHCLSNVANRAEDRLSRRLMIHNALTQIIDALGENDWPGWGGKQVPFVKLGNCCEIWHRRATV